MYFGKLVGIIHSHLSLLEGMREMVPLVGGGEPASQVPDECWLV